MPYKNFNKELFNVHVKTCNLTTLNYINDYSWTFQNQNKSSKGGKDSILIDSNDDLISLVYCDDYKANVGYIKYLGKFSEIKSFLKNPKSPKLIEIKKCIYFKDIEIRIL